MRALFLISLFFLTFTAPAYAANKSASLIDFAKVQYAGEVGFISVGVGMKFATWYELTAMYGFVPAFLDVDDIHSIALKNDFSFYRPSDKWRFYLDLTLVLAMGKKYWPAFHDNNMKEWYYYNSGMEGILAFGFEYSLPKSLGMENFSVYGEYGVLAQWLYLYKDHSEYIPFKDITTLTFGFNYSF